MIYNKEIITGSQRVSIHNIFNHPIISFALGEGGFIAGGFSRQVLKNPNELYNYLTGSTQLAGDIDIFFPSVQSYELTLKFAISYCNTKKKQNADPFSSSFDVRASLTNFCTNILLPEVELFARTAS